MRGTFLASGGVLKVGMDRLVSEKFGISRSEANRLIADGEVTIDGEVSLRKDIEVDAVAGTTLRIGREAVEVPAE